MRRGPRQPQHRRTIISLEAFADSWNGRDAKGAVAQFTPDGVRHRFALPEARRAGREAIAHGVDAILHAVSNASLEVRSQSVVQDGGVTVEWTFSGVLIDEERVYWDMATLMSLAGVLG